MRFSVVGSGYDQRQVDSCLDEIGVRLTRLAARAEGAARAGRVWDEIRDEAAGLRGLLHRLDLGDPGRSGRDAGAAEREAADLLARARVELDAAREEARQVRERVYAEAVQARRDFEAALYARRRRADRVDRILDGLTVEPVPADTPTAAAGVPGGVPATRIAGGGGADASSDPPGGRAGIR
ncbi:ATPase [Micromonospora sp. CPCC 205561]|uniref:ATPase n=1 Tax=Micromonospora sp. CPCC 205561 TaxID=3122407 RepID=UPI002FF143B9